MEVCATNDACVSYCDAPMKDGASVSSTDLPTKSRPYQQMAPEVTDILNGL